MSTLQRAIEIAVSAHKGQLDKNGAPYVEHVFRVMHFGKTPNEKIVGVLHDLIEDTSWTFTDLSNEGFSNEVISALKCLTKENNEDYSAFINRVKVNQLAIRVKIYDLEDNLNIRRLKEISVKDMNRLNKYLKAYTELQSSLV